MATMRALVKTEKGPGHIEVMDMPIPEPDETEVLIQIKYAGICGTDIHIWHDAFTYYPPVILGHEFSGTVAAAGKKATRFPLGSRVVAEPHSKACGVCPLCRNGHIQICDQKRSPGWGMNGAFAEYLVMPEPLLHGIPDEIPDEDAALLEPCAIAAHQVLERGRIMPGDTVVVCGAGPIGILSAQMAHIAGAAKVLLTGLDRDTAVRFTAARQLACVDRFVNVQREDLADAVMRETDGIGADVVIEASGAEEAIKSAVRILKKRGRLIAIGLAGRETIAFPWDLAMVKVLDVLFNMSSSFTGWDMAIKLMAAGTLRVRPLISAIDGLDQWESSFQKCQNGQALKILFKP